MKKNQLYQASDNMMIIFKLIFHALFISLRRHTFYILKDLECTITPTNSSDMKESGAKARNMVTIIIYYCLYYYYYYYYYYYL